MLFGSLNVMLCSSMSARACAFQAPPRRSQVAFCVGA